MTHTTSPAHSPDQSTDQSTRTEPTAGAFRVLVTGSRDWTDSATIEAALTVAAAHAPAGRVLVLVHGDARGADRIAAHHAARTGWRVEAHPARWDRDGRAAGYRRNAAMVAAGADLCLAFIRDHSAGATQCADLADRAGIRTRRYLTLSSFPTTAEVAAALADLQDTLHAAIWQGDAGTAWPHTLGQARDLLRQVDSPDLDVLLDVGLSAVDDLDRAAVLTAAVLAAATVPDPTIQTSRPHGARDSR
jgi:hypothetical protein